jgi:hypothetical protein
MCCGILVYSHSGVIHHFYLHNAEAAPSSKQNSFKCACLYCSKINFYIFLLIYALTFKLTCQFILICGWGFPHVVLIFRDDLYARDIKGNKYSLLYRIPILNFVRLSLVYWLDTSFAAWSAFDVTDIQRKIATLTNKFILLFITRCSNSWNKNVLHVIILIVYWH